jgi:hypothetical protein
MADCLSANPPYVFPEFTTLQKKPSLNLMQSLSGLAAQSGGVAQLTPLKDKDRAIAKINARYKGNASQIRDVLRGSIVVGTAADVDKAFNLVKDVFPVDFARNGYAAAVHSSDGYFDAKLEIITYGIFAEIQIHTQAMIVAKDEAHVLYEQRQAILRSSGKEMSAEQRKQVLEINKKMRDIFRKVDL